MRGKDQHRFGHRGRPARRAHAAGSATRPSPPPRQRRCCPAASSSETWKCMPEPAYFSIGLAMKQAVTPCRRAGGAHQPLQHDEIVGRLHHVLAVVQRQLVLARRIFGDHRLGRDALRVRRRRRCRKTAAPCRADGRPNRPRSCRSCGRRARRSAGCTRPSASRSLASRKNSSSKAPAGCRPFVCEAPRPAAPARGAGRKSSAAPSRWYIDISTWPRAGAGAVQRHQRAGDRPAAQIAVAGIPDQPGLVDVLAGDVEAEDRDRQMPAVLVKRQSVRGGG